MTYPIGVQLATLTFSNPVTFLGADTTRTDLAIQSTANVVWAATGVPIDNFPERVAPTPGTPGFLTAPYVDQDGFTDQAGNAFKNWAYTLTRTTFFNGQSKEVRKTWQPILGQPEIDFDKLPGGSIGLPVAVPIPPVTSVNGKTHAVTVVEATAENVAAVLPPRLSAENIAAGLAPKLDATTAAATYASGNVHFIVSATAPTETTVNGKTVVWIDTSTTATSVTATAPTFNDSTDTYTIPTSTGVDYKIGGVLIAAGTYAVTAPATVVVDAVAQPGYIITGTAQWTGTFTTAATYSSVVLADAPTLYWPLDDAAGTTARSAGAVALPLTGNPVLGAAGIGDGATSADFNGSQYLATAANLELNGATSLSVEYIVHPDAVNGIRAAVQQSTALEALIFDGTVTAKIGATAYVRSTGTIPAAARSHVAITWDGANVKFYINGALNSTVAYASTVTASSNALYIGNSTTTGTVQYDGRMAGVAIYKNAVLTAARILAHAQAAGVA